MSSNDGKQLLVFGLSFAQHDNRKMQQLLRHYDRLPDNPGIRANLFVQLNKVARELMADEAAQDQIKQLTNWMTKGGDFPLAIPSAPEPTPASTGDQPRPAQSAHNGNRQGSSHVLPHIPGRYRHYGQGRTLSGQPSTANQPSSSSHGVATTQPHAANLGRQYGRGRTVDGDWEQNDEQEGDDNHDDGEAEGATDTRMGDEDEEMEDWMDDEDDEMHGRMERQFGAPPWANPFAGAGHTLNDPSEQPSTAAAVNEDDTTGPMNTEAQLTPEEQRFHADMDLLFGGDEAADNGFDDDDDSSVTRNSSLEPEDDGREIECPICLEDYPRSRFPKLPTVTKSCDHPDKACLNCLDSSITAIIERGALHLLACPICPQKLSPRNIREYANPEVYERYKYLKHQSEIPGHWISCTNPTCGGSQPHDSEDPMMICKHCKFATCAKHRRPWHEGQTCREFDLDDAQLERLEEEEATAKLLSGEAVSICPKCGQGVTKTEGCDNMVCSCGQAWCYICSCSTENIIRLGATAHATFCIYHPNKVNLTKSQQEAARSRIMGLVHGGEVSAELARAREDLRRRRREEIRPKAAEAAEARMRLQRERDQEQERDGPPEKKKRKVKLVAPWEEGGWTKKAL